MANKKKLSTKQKRLLSLALTLKELKPSHRTIILDHLDDESRDALYALISKVLNSTSIPKSRQTSLKRIVHLKKREFKELLDKSKSKSHRKKRLTQVGGGLPFILATAIPLLLNLFGL